MVSVEFRPSDRERLHRYLDWLNSTETLQEAYQSGPHSDPHTTDVRSRRREVIEVRSSNCSTNSLTRQFLSYGHGEIMKSWIVTGSQLIAFVLWAIPPVNLHSMRSSAI